jgi:hypothetical protein
MKEYTEFVTGEIEVFIFMKIMGKASVDGGWV